MTEVTNGELVKEVAVAGVNAKSVKARWAPANEDEAVGEANREGLIEWICRVEGGASIDLSLDWDVTVPQALKWEAI